MTLKNSTQDHLFLRPNNLNFFIVLHPTKSLNDQMARPSLHVHLLPRRGLRLRRQTNHVVQGVLTGEGSDLGFRGVSSLLWRGAHTSGGRDIRAGAVGEFGQGNQGDLGVSLTYWRICTIVLVAIFPWKSRGSLSPFYQHHRLLSIHTSTIRVNVIIVGGVGDHGLLYSRNTDKMFIFNIHIYLTNNFKDNYISFYSQIDCSASSSVLDLSPDYRKSAGLRYPVNVGRNVARQSANTHFVFPSDVELYPTPGINEFFSAPFLRSSFSSHNISSLRLWHNQERKN